MLWISTDDFACVAPGRLRHSWLDNQVLLVLRQGGILNVSPVQLSRMVEAWTHDAGDLLRYAHAFPDVVDPGVFLRCFARKRNVAVSDAMCAELSAKFEEAFVAGAGRSVADFQVQLVAASEQASLSLDALVNDLRHRAPGSAVSTQDPTLLAALRSASRVHELLGLAPRGVCLV